MSPHDVPTPGQARAPGRLRRRATLVLLAGLVAVPAGRVARGPAEPSATRAEPTVAVRAEASTTSRPTTTATEPSVARAVLIPPATTVAASAERPQASPVVSSLGRSGIPVVALAAYGRAAATMSAQAPGCGVSWSVVAAIGRVESNHGRYGGSELLADGRGTRPIRGIPLDGRPGVAHISDSDGGRLDDDPVYDRAVGPMQFIPSSWRRVAADGNGDGRADPDNIFDAALTAAVYLCAAGGDMHDEGGRRAAVYSYNHSAAYVATVLGLAEQYAAGGYSTLPSGSAPPTPGPVPTPATPLPPATPGMPLGVPDPGAFRPLPPLGPPSPAPTTTTTTSTTTTSSTTTTTTTTTEPCPAPDPAATPTAPEPCPTEPERAEAPPADPVAAPAPGT